MYVIFFLFLKKNVRSGMFYILFIKFSKDIGYSLIVMLIVLFGLIKLLQLLVVYNKVFKFVFVVIFVFIDFIEREI